MRRFLFALLTGIKDWIFSVPGIIALAITIVAVALSSIYWDTLLAPAFATSLKPFLVKALPKYVSLLARASLPFLSKALARRWVRSAFVILLGKVLTPDEKERIRNSKERAVSLVRINLVEKPHRWWSSKSEKAQLIISASLVGSAALLLLTPLVGSQSVIYIMLFFWRFIWNLFVWLFRFLFPEVGAVISAKIMEQKVLLRCIRLIPDRLKQHQFLNRVRILLTYSGQRLDTSVQKLNSAVRKRIGKE